MVTKISMERGENIEFLPGTIYKITDGFVAQTKTNEEGRPYISRIAATDRPYLGLEFLGAANPDALQSSYLGHTIDALSDVTAETIPASKLFAEMAQNEHLRASIIKEICDKTKRGQEFARARNGQPPLKKVLALTILDLAERWGKNTKDGAIKIHQPFMQQTILSKLIGMSRESMNLSLIDWRRNEIINYEDPRNSFNRSGMSTLFILKPEKLADIADIDITQVFPDLAL